MYTKYKIVPFCPYHFVRTILSNTILSVYHFVHTILSVPFCPLPFCPVTESRRNLFTRISNRQHSISDNASPKPGKRRRAMLIIFVKTQCRCCCCFCFCCCCCC